MNDTDRLTLHARAVAALRERIADESYLTITEVGKRLGISRAVVEALPMEILPYADFGRGQRQHRRYHPADVLAADARMRAWRRAQAQDHDEEYLRELRAKLDEMDAQAIEAALEMRRSA